MKRTAKEELIIERIVNYSSSIKRLVDNMGIAIAELEQHTRNRIAAHNAHTTMAKQKRSGRKLPVVRLRGI